MKRSKHSLSHYRLTTFNQGILYPVACEEILPGDSFRHQTSVLLRVSPLVAPVMHPCHLAVHHWFVPSRILWDNWEPFITGRDPNLQTPVLTYGPADPCLPLAQSLGIGVGTAAPAPVVVNALPFRAYNRIFNEFYRDQNLTTKRAERTGDTGDLPADYDLVRPSWEKDYFTTARTYPQQGSGLEAVALQMSGQAKVSGIGMFGAPEKATSSTVVETPQPGGSDPTNATYPASWISSGTGIYVKSQDVGTKPRIYAEMAGSSAAATMDINEWRRAMAMQRMREHRNRYGERYRDMLAFLGVNSSDARLQRPEYLGGGKQTIAFSEVLSTAETTTSVVGEMAGHGIAALRTRPYKRFFEEHGYLISLILVRPVTVYNNRVPRHFMRRDYESYWQKELEIMGDQAITNFEVYGDSATPNTVFGYVPRYDEYRHGESSVSGEFRNLLNYWHMARDFSSQPALNQTFVACNPTNRIYASTTNDQLYAMVAHRISARRLVSKRART